MRIEALSHGNQQRVQLAAALVHDPRVLVLDEPFSGLDPLGIKDMAEVLRELAQAGVTVVFSSYQLDLVQDVCDEVAVIDRERSCSRARFAPSSSTVPPASSWRSRVSSRTGTEGWAPRQPSALTRTGVRVTFHDADPQVVLDRARAAGMVRRFAIQEPSLSELFLQAVGP